MTLWSLPHYPRHRARSVERVADVPPTLRAPRPNLLINLALLTAILALLWWARELSSSIAGPPPVSPALEFDQVVERFGEVKLLQTRREVMGLLGRPSVQTRPEPELAKMAIRAEHANRHLGMPIERVWEMWIDPNDQDRWVAVLFADGEVYARGMSPRLRDPVGRE